MIIDVSGQTATYFVRLGRSLLRSEYRVVVTERSKENTESSRHARERGLPVAKNLDKIAVLARSRRVLSTASAAATAAETAARVAKRL